MSARVRVPQIEAQLRYLCDIMTHPDKIFVLGICWVTPPPPNHPSDFWGSHFGAVKGLTRAIGNPLMIRYEFSS